MTLCQFVEIEGRPGYQWCPVCERVRGWPNEQRRPSPLPEKLRRVCTGTPSATRPEAKAIPKTSATGRVRRFREAYQRWADAGKPLRTDEQKAALFSICETCPSGEFDPKPIAPGLAGGKCKACGCGLARERNIANKIAWATEDCPRGHWPKADKRDPDPDDGRAG